MVEAFITAIYEGIIAGLQFERNLYFSVPFKVFAVTFIGNFFSFDEPREDINKGNHFVY